MATEHLPASPRLSFSENIRLDTLAEDDCNRSDGFLPLEAGSGDFNFNVILQSSISDSSDADELFSGGKLLPIFKAAIPAENNSSPLLRPILDSTGGSGSKAGTAASLRRENSWHSIWRVGRSSSLRSVTPTDLISPFPLHRSKSTGSFPQPSPRLPLAAGNKSSSQKIAVDPNPRKTYYYSGSKRGSHRSGVGVRIIPVLNLPAPMMSKCGSGSSSSSATVTSIFSYLLCNCGGEERRDEPEFVDSFPTKRNGMERVSFVALYRRSLSSDHHKSAGSFAGGPPLKKGVHSP